MDWIDNDIAFLRASVPELEKYLLSNVLYYPVTAERGRQLSGDTTQLTIGNVLLSTARLRALNLPPEKAEQVEPILMEIDRTRSRWYANWKKKAELEIPNRLRLWKNHLDEWIDSSASRGGDYHYNVRQRVILELLLGESDELFVQEKSLLRRLDLRLKGKGVPGDFIWDEQVKSAFPPDRFWFLYLHF